MHFLGMAEHRLTCSGPGVSCRCGFISVQAIEELLPGFSLKEKAAPVAALMVWWENTPGGVG